MFKGNNQTPSKSMDYNSPDKLNRIVEGTKIQGEITSESNIRVDGEVIGTITTKGRMVIGSKGKVVGTISCHNAEIEGHIEGTIVVSELLSLKSTAKVEGEIITSKLAIEAGAEFSGTCQMGNHRDKKLKSNAKVTSDGLLQED